MKKKNKGFTLIELLAVIVILAIVALISVPIVLNLIEKSRKGAFARSAEGVLKASNLYYLDNLLEANENKDISFNCDNNKCIASELGANGNEILLNVNGNIGQGNINIFATGEVIFSLTNGKYCAAKYKEEKQIYIYDGNCSDIDITNDRSSPIINVINTSSTASTITVTVVATDPDSGIYGYSYSKDSGKSWSEIISNNVYSFKDLEKGTYGIKVRVYNGTYGKNTYTEEKGMAESDVKNVETKVVNLPEFNVEPDSWSINKIITIMYPEGYKNYYIINNDDNLIEYKEPIKLEKNGTITAIVKEGDVVVSSNSYEITKIDLENPIINVTYKLEDGTDYISETWVNQNVVVTVSGTDDGEIDKYQITYDGENFEDILGNNIIIKESTNLRIKAIDKVGHESELSEEYIINIDRENPAVTYSVMGGKYNTNQTIRVTANDSNYSNMYVHVYKDGHAYENGILVNEKSVNATNETSFDVSLDNDGIYVVYTLAHDKAGKKQSQSPENVDGWYYQEYIIDTTIPTATIKAVKSTAGTTVASNSWSNQTLKFTLTKGTEGVSGSKLYYCVDTVNKCTPNTEVASGTAFTRTNTGTYYVRYKAVGGTGKESVVGSYIGKVDTTTPTVSIKAVKSSAGTTVATNTWSNQTLKFTLTKGTTGSSGYTIKYCVDTANTCTPSTTIASGTAFTRTNTGTYYLRYNITSGAGTVSATGSYTGKVDTSSPTISLGTITKTTNSITIPYTASSNLSGNTITCVYGTSTSYGSTGTISENKCVISGLSASTKYYYKITNKNGLGTSVNATGNTTTNNVGYSIGKAVTLKDGSTWYVIENSPATSSTVTLFSSKNINTEGTGWTNDYTLYERSFDTANARTTEKNTYCITPENGCNIYAAQAGTVTNGDYSGTVTEDSTIKKFVDGKVKTYINNKLTSSGGVNINSIRLITEQEICNILNAANSSNNCSVPITAGLYFETYFDNIPSWLLTSNYWIMTPENTSTSSAQAIAAGKGLSSRYATAGTSSSWYIGVRPVIVTSKSNIK